MEKRRMEFPLDLKFEALKEAICNQYGLKKCILLWRRRDNYATIINQESLDEMKSKGDVGCYDLYVATAMEGDIYLTPIY
jgi:hypothetical protein